MKVIFLDKIPLNSDYEYTINTSNWNDVIAKLINYSNFGMFLDNYPYDDTYESDVLVKKGWIECNLENIDNVNYFVSVDLHKNPYHNNITSYNYMLAYDGAKVHHFFVENVKHISSKIYSETNITSRYDISLKKNLFAEYNINENFNGNSHIHTKRKHCKTNDEHNRNVEDNYEPSYCIDKYEMEFIRFSYYSTITGQYVHKYINPSIFSNDLFAYIFATEKITPEGLVSPDNQFYFRSYGVDLPIYVYCVPLRSQSMYFVYEGNTYYVQSSLDDVDNMLLTNPKVYKVVISDMPPINISNEIDYNNERGEYSVSTNSLCLYSIEGGSFKAFICCKGREDKEKPYFTVRFNFPNSYYDEDKLNYYPYNCYCIVNGNKTSYYNFKSDDYFNLYYDFSIENIIRTISYPHTGNYNINGNESKSLLNEYVQDNTSFMATDYWKEFIAQNKNYYYQGVVVPLVKGISNTLIGGATAIGYGMTGSPQAAIGATGNSVLSAINAGISIANSNMNWDNIKNTPNSVKTLGINLQKSLRVGELKPYCLRYSVVPSLIPLIENKFKHYGYQYDDECDYKDFFAKENYNYILTIEDVIDKKAISMTNYERKIINDIFKRGITMFGENCIMYDEQSNPYIDYTDDNPDRS